MQSGARALRLHDDLIDRLDVVFRQLDDGEEMLLLKDELASIAVASRVASELMNSAKRAKDIGWVATQVEQSYDAIDYEIKEVE